MAIWSILARTAFHLMALVLALVCAFLAFGLYEDEERRLGDRLADLWAKIDDAGRSAISRQVAFMRVTSGATDCFLTRLFGDRLWAPRAIGVSICWSLTSLAVAGVLGTISAQITEGGVPDWSVFCLGIGLCGIATLLALLGLQPYRRKWVSPSRTWWFACAIAVAVTCLLAGAVLIPKQGIPRDALGGSTYLFGVLIGFLLVSVGLLCSVSSDYLVILATRWAVRRISRENAIAWMLAFLAGNFGAFFIVTAPPVLVLILSTHTRGVFIPILAGFVLVSNILTAGFALVLVAVGIALLAHRAAWPLMARATYALDRYQIVHRKKMFATLSGSFLIAAFPSWGSVISAVGSRLK